MYENEDTAADENEAQDFLRLLRGLEEVPKTDRASGALAAAVTRLNAPRF